jgi:hypothetical protein
MLTHPQLSPSQHQLAMIVITRTLWQPITNHQPKSVKQSDVPKDFENENSANFELGKKSKIHHKVWRRNVVVKCGKYRPAKFANFLLIYIMYGKICKIRRAIFSSLYNISRPNFAIVTNFIMLFLAVVMDFILLA